MMKSIQTGTRFDEDNIIVIMYNILMALNYMHTSGIVHRDLKPKSIQLTKNCEVFLTNFEHVRSLNMENGVTLSKQLVRDYYTGKYFKVRANGEAKQDDVVFDREKDKERLKRAR